MAHKFDRTKHDPYSEAARQLGEHLFTDPRDVEAGADEEIYSLLSTTIVESLGDIAWHAARLGVTSPKQVHGLVSAIQASVPRVFETYLGEIDAEPVLQAIESDPRMAALAPETRDELQQEIEKTRRLESETLSARRLDELLD